MRRNHLQTNAGFPPSSPLLFVRGKARKEVILVQPGLQEMPHQQTAQSNTRPQCFKIWIIALLQKQKAISINESVLQRKSTFSPVEPVKYKPTALQCLPGKIQIERTLVRVPEHPWLASTVPSSAMQIKKRFQP